MELSAFCRLYKIEKLINQVEMWLGKRVESQTFLVTDFYLIRTDGFSNQIEQQYENNILSSSEKPSYVNQMELIKRNKIILSRWKMSSRL